MDLPIKKSKNKGESLNSQFSGWLFIIPAALLFLMFKYVPIIMGTFVTFFDYNIVNPPGNFVGLRNYIAVLTESRFHTSLINTFEFFLIMLVLDFWVPIVVAILVNEARRGNALFRTLYFIPAIAPSIAMTVLWKYVWQPDYGFANYLMQLVGLPMQKWLNDPMLVKWCLRFPQFIMAGGLAFVIYLAALQDIPEEEFEASLIDGAGFLQKIRYIVFPHLRHVISLMLVLLLIEAFNYFDEPMVMTGGGPIGKTETLIMYSFKSAYRDSRYSFAITLAVITFVIVLACTVAKEALSRKDDD
ncbi:MAG: sugar ABC transporter permease [Oscillospiraceae bacterium]|nr:sugar ABC transporter permease [Oscillospiraceae bacterium]